MAGENAYEFLCKEATQDERGTYHVTQKNYMSFMAQNGITKDVMEAVDNVHGELYNGMYRFNIEKLKENGDIAVKEGRDPKAERVVTVINCPGGNIRMVSNMAKTYPIPKQPGETVTKPAVSSLEHNRLRLMDKELVSSCEEEIRAHFKF